MPQYLSETTSQHKETENGKPYIRLDKNNAAMLLVDHQTGLLSLVRDIDPDKFKNNILATADLAKYFGLPTILTLKPLVKNNWLSRV